MKKTAVIKSALSLDSQFFTAVSSIIKHADVTGTANNAEYISKKSTVPLRHTVIRRTTNNMNTV